MISRIGNKPEIRQSEKFNKVEDKKKKNQWQLQFKYNVVTTKTLYMQVLK